MSQVTPRQPVPSLTVPLLGGGMFDIASEKPDNFSLVVVYRGLHCPVCKGYMNELATMAPEFAARGTTVLALSTDSEERARRTSEQWKLDGLRIGYGLPIETARAWGLFISAGKAGGKPGMEEPAHFAEPGVFLIRPDATLYASIINTMPFARPHLKDVLSGIDFIVKNDYPARGEA